MRRSLIRLCLVVGVLTFSSSGYAQIRVACVGNSITQGVGLGPNPAYPAILQQKFNSIGSNYVVRNYGLSGRTMLKNGDISYWKEAKYLEVLAWNPDIVIIKLGTNDSKTNRDKTGNWDEHKDEFYSDYVEFIKSFKKPGSNPKIYICLPIPVIKDKDGITDAIIRKEVIPLIKKAAQHTKSEIINLYAAFYKKKGFYFLDADGNIVDGIHPNADGAALIAEEVFKAITK